MLLHYSQGCPCNQMVLAATPREDGQPTRQAVALERQQRELSTGELGHAPIKAVGGEVEQTGTAGDLEVARDGACFFGGRETMVQAAF